MHTIGDIIRRPGFAVAAWGLAAAGLLSAVPVLGLAVPVLASGYAWSALGDAASSDGSPLGGWDRLGEYLLTGLRATFVGLAVPLLVAGPFLTGALVIIGPSLLGRLRALEALIEATTVVPAAPLSPDAAAAAMVLLLLATLAIASSIPAAAGLCVHGAVSGTGWKGFLAVGAARARYRSARREFWSGFWGSAWLLFLGGLAIGTATLVVSAVGTAVLPFAPLAAIIVMSGGPAAFLPFRLAAAFRYLPYVRAAYGAAELMPADMPAATHASR